MKKPGLYIAKNNHDAINDDNPNDFDFYSPYDTYKYLQTLGPYMIQVSDCFGDGSTGVTVTIPIPIPNNYNFIPYFYSWIVPSGSGLTSSYDYNTTNFSEAWVSYASGASLQANLAYLNGGEGVFTELFYVYLFGNAI